MHKIVAKSLTDGEATISKLTNRLAADQKSMFKVNNPQMSM